MAGLSLAGRGGLVWLVIGATAASRRPHLRPLLWQVVLAMAARARHRRPRAQALDCPQPSVRGHSRCARGGCTADHLLVPVRPRRICRRRRVRDHADAAAGTRPALGAGRARRALAHLRRRALSARCRSSARSSASRLASWSPAGAHGIFRLLQLPKISGEVAQLVEHQTENLGVVSSILTLATILRPASGLRVYPLHRLLSASTAVAVRQRPGRVFVGNAGPGPSASSRGASRYPRVAARGALRAPAVC